MTRLSFLVCLAVVILTGAMLPVPAASMDPLEGDARLERPVRVTSPGIGVAALLARLSKASGVSLTADTAAGEDKVTLYGPARPVREVLGDLAELFGHRWQRRRVGAETRYVLAVDPEVRRRSKALAEAPVEGFLTALDAQARALRETPLQLARRPESDPVRKALSDPQGRQSMALFAMLNSRQRRQLVEWGHYRVLFSQLPPEHQATIQRNFAEQERKTGDTFISSVKITMVRRVNPPDVSFSTARWSQHPASRLVLRMYPLGFPFADVWAPEPLPAALRGNPYGRESAGAQAPPTVTGPFPAGRDWPSRLQELAEKTGLPVLSDYYRLHCRPDGLDARPTIKDAASPWDAFAYDAGSRWWTRGRSVLFRKRDWFQRDRYEIPDPWLDTTTALLRAHGETPRLGDLLRVADLSTQQQLAVSSLGVERSVAYDTFEDDQERTAGLPELLALLKGRYPPRSRKDVRLVRQSTIPREQYEAVERSVTLTYADMMPDQRALLLPFLLAQRENLDGVALERFSVTVWPEEPRDVKDPAPGMPRCRFVPLTINWRMGRSRGSFDRLTLPLTVPDDRRTETRVEVDASK